MLGLLPALALTSPSVAEPAPVPGQWPAPSPEVLTGLDPDVLSLALRAYGRAQASGQARRPVLAIIDYSKPSSERRLWVLDLAAQRLVFHEWVAHGRNSGEEVAWPPAWGCSSRARRTSDGTACP